MLCSFLMDMLVYYSQLTEEQQTVAETGYLSVTPPTPPTRRCHYSKQYHKQPVARERHDTKLQPSHACLAWRIFGGAGCSS